MAYSPTMSAERAGPARTARAVNIGLWVLQLLGAVALFGAGASKLAGADAMVTLFDTIGMGQWFRYLTGGIEVVGAVLLLVPALAGVGALLLAAVMAGAVVTEWMLPAGSVLGPLPLLLIVSIVAYGRREQLRRLLGR
jgi:putative oxidoreductase